MHQASVNHTWNEIRQGMPPTGVSTRDYEIGSEKLAANGATMTEEPFEPFWEREREDFFSKFDYTKVETPAYIIHERVLEDNLKILKRVKDKTGAKLLLALKGYAAWKTFPLIRKYLDGVCASSANEARLGKEKFGKEVHTFAPAYTYMDIKEHLQYSDHIIFNSFNLWKKYRKTILQHNKDNKNKRKIECGIRINPESAGAENALYNPCAPGSRMGVTISEFRKHEGELEGISGLHFHALCEQNVDALEDALANVEKKFGKYIKRMRWVNFGGGHHITRNDYNVGKLSKLINNFKKKYNVEVILEPGEAVALNAGVLVSTVLDIIENDGKIAMMDTTAEDHMPDVLAMPYRPSIVGAEKPGRKKYTYTLGGLTCLSGDFIGKYSFDKELKVGDKLVFQNMAIYTMVKNTVFNGVRLPSIILMDKNNKVVHVKKFGYKEYMDRLS
jgi:carboxynorspermidine decarboxylase